MKRANAAEAILITIDKDFGELVYRSGLSSKGVILLRLETLPSHAKAAVLAAVVEQHGAELLQASTVVLQHSIRIRPLQQSGKSS